MTWLELRKRLDDLDKDQLASEVCFFNSDRHCEVLHLSLYIAEHRMKDESQICGDIKKNMPYLDF